MTSSRKLAPAPATAKVESISTKQRRQMSMNRLSIAQTEFGWGLRHYHHQRFAKALKNFHLALQYYTQLQHATGIGKSLNGLSGVYLQIQQYGQALACSQAAIAALEATSARQDYALATYQLGVSHLKLQHFSEAEAALNKAITLYHALGDAINEDRVLLHLGQVYAYRQEYMFAIACYEAAIDSLMKQPLQTDTRSLVMDAVNLLLNIQAITTTPPLQTSELSERKGGLSSQ